MIISSLSSSFFGTLSFFWIVSNLGFSDFLDFGILDFLNLELFMHSMCICMCIYVYLCRRMDIGNNTGNAIGNPIGDFIGNPIGQMKGDIK